jgi:hypothetical protein
MAAEADKGKRDVCGGGKRTGCILSLQDTGWPGDDAAIDRGGVVAGGNGRRGAG